MRQISGTRLSVPLPETISAISRWCGLSSPCRPRIVTCSSPFMPNDCQDVPSSNTSGITPMPIRFERWMRSNDCVITARMPRRTERKVVGIVADGGVIHRHPLLRWIMHREAAFHARHHLVLEPDIGEGPAHHYFVIAAPRAVLVEVGRLNLVLDQIFAGRRIHLDRTGRRNVVGGDRVEEQSEHARVHDVLERFGSLAHADEIGRVLRVRGFVVPVEGHATLDGYLAPIHATLALPG